MTAIAAEFAPAATDDPSRYSRAAVGAVAALLAAGSCWATTANFGGAVVAPATVIVAGKAKLVQHREGGVISAIKVREGDTVAAGAVVMELDDTQPKAELAIAMSQLQTLVARKDRLTAERDGREMRLSLDEDIHPGDAQFRAVWEGERALFHSRMQSREGQKRQLAERVVQADEQGDGRAAQMEARQRELQTVRREVDELRPLRQRGLVTAQRFNTLERSLFSLEGEIASTRSAIAAARAQASEYKMQIANVDRDAATEVAKDLRETEDKLAEVREKIVAARDRFAKTRVRAPAAGVVHQMSAGTVGGVANAGETLMQVVPVSERMMLEAKVERADIDRAAATTTARIRFTALDRRTTPELIGTIARIAADAEIDQKTNAWFYKVEVALDKAEVQRLGAVALKPGMPAEVYLETGERTPLQYFAKPLIDQLSRAFTER